MKNLKIYQTLLIIITLGLSINAQLPCVPCNSADYDYQINSISFSNVDGDNCIQETSSSTATITWFMNSPSIDVITGVPAGSWYIQISFPQTGEYGYEAGNTIIGPEFNWIFDEANSTLRGYSNVDMVFGAGGDIEIQVTGLMENDCIDVVTNVNAFTTLPGDENGCHCLAAFQPDISNDAQTSSIGIAPESTLPVELTAFTATKKEQTAKLDWTTHMEINNDRFEIERSVDGRRFENIGKVQGNGTTNQASYYTYVDENPISGINYYKLKQLDKNGEYSYSEVRQLRFDAPASKAIRVMPNPVVEYIQVDNLAGNNVQEIMIFDESQRLVRTIKLDEQAGVQRFDLSALQSGMYHMRFVGQGFLHTEKIVKMAF